MLKGVGHAFNPSPWEAEAGGSYELEASLVYRVSSKTVRATQKNPVSKKPNQTKTKPSSSVKQMGSQLKRLKTELCPLITYKY